MSKPQKIETTLAAPSARAVLLAASALVACSSDVVDLGNDGVVQRLERGSRCSDSPIALGPIEISNQEQLEELAGCEEVRGDLAVYVYEGTDLSPLSSLRAVTGRFMLGTSPVPTEETLDTWADEEAQREQIAAAGWLPSLAGVDALERVGSLELQRIGAPDLRAFENLRSVSSGDDPASAGVLFIWDAKALIDLAGLDNVRGIGTLRMQGNPVLESLAGVTLGSSLPGFVSLFDNPRLTDVSALRPLEGVPSLSVWRCGVRDLDALERFAYASSIDIRENPELVDVLGIGNASFSQLLVERNPKLLRFPEFPNGASSSEVRIVGNAALEAVFSSFSTAIATIEFDGRQYYTGKDWIEITDNPKLASIALYDNEESASHLGITSGQLFAANRNASMRRIDLGS